MDHKERDALSCVISQQLPTSLMQMRTEPPLKPDIFLCAMCTCSFIQFSVLLKHLEGHYKQEATLCLVHVVPAQNGSVLYKVSAAVEMDAEERVANTDAEEVGVDEHIEMEVVDMVEYEAAKDEDEEIPEVQSPLEELIKVEDTESTTPVQEMKKINKGASISSAAKKTCAECGKVLKNAACLRQHMKIFHVSGAKKFKCCECLKSFLTQTALDIHSRVHTKVKPFKCINCNKAFSRAKGLESHMAVHQPDDQSLICDVCGQKYPQSKFKEHLKTHSGETFDCDQCERTYQSSGGLRTHQIKAHSNTRDFFCEVCSKSFNFKHELTKHMKTHSSERFECSQCMRYFKVKDSLDLHMAEHEGVVPDGCFKCSQCPRLFRSEKMLEKHMTVHSEVKGHKCMICGKEYCTSASLKAHLALHITPRQWHCSVCGKTFLRKGTLDRHLMVHGDERRFQCKVCNAKFQTNTNLKIHMRTHTDERPYQCPTCYKSFRTSSHLRSHQMVHTGERPFTCSVCSKTYRKSSHLRDHMKTHSSSSEALGENTVTVVDVESFNVNALI